MPKISFSIRDDAKFEKVLQKGNKIYLNNKDFIEIKDKKIFDFVRIYLSSVSDKLSKVKEIKSSIINLPVPKSNEILNEIIKKGSTDTSKIKEKVKKLEQEINDLVYEIYRISKQERKIIEDNL